MNIYIFSGLGADKRAFKYLRFPKDVNVVHVDWILPLENETIQSYSKRISADIDTSKPFILIGLSFGGMMAIELSKFLKPVKIILISSVAKHIEMPFYFKIIGKLGLNKLIPKGMKTKSNFIFNWLFSIQNEKEKQMLDEILEASQPDFTHWALNEILNWKMEGLTENVIRIHGDKDRIFPVVNFNPDYLILDGGHLMVVNKAAEISDIIHNEIM